MSVISIEGGTFEKEGHIYRTELGVWVPSITGILRLQGLTDYSMVAPDVLKKAQERGTAVHELVAAHQIYGEIDTDFLTEETLPYWNAYLKFRGENNYVPDTSWVERGIIATLFGMKIAMTPDSVGKLNGYDSIVEFKCVAVRQKSWPIQTGAQECGVYKTTRAGRAQRIAVQLRGDGTYRMDSHTNHLYDISQFTAALTTVYGRLDMGQELWKRTA